MGLYTIVEPDNKVLPLGFHDRTDWQTKDVIEAQLDTLKITADGKLIHVQGRYGSTGFHETALDYTGEMRFYCGTDDDLIVLSLDLIKFVSHFIDGRLQKIERAEN